MIDPKVGDVMRRGQSNLRKLAVWASIRFESSPPRCLPATRTFVPKYGYSHWHTHTMATGNVPWLVILGRDRLFRDQPGPLVPWNLSRQEDTGGTSKKRLSALGPGTTGKSHTPPA